VQRIVFARDGRVLQLGSPERCFNGSQRRAIAVRDGGCVIPGCHVPAGWCEVHHVIPHAHDPSGTHTDNGVLLCWFHHRTIDTSGWQIRMRGGVPEVKAPNWLDHTGNWRRGIGSPARIAEGCIHQGTTSDFLADGCVPHGTSSTFPVVARPSSARCASAASSREYVAPTRTCSDPPSTRSNSSPVRSTSSSRVAV
jgi:hypothetical protein